MAYAVLGTCAALQARLIRPKALDVFSYIANGHVKAKVACSWSVIRMKYEILGAIGGTHQFHVLFQPLVDDD